MSHTQINKLLMVQVFNHWGVACNKINSPQPANFWLPNFLVWHGKWYIKTVTKTRVHNVPPTILWTLGYKYECFLCLALNAANSIVQGRIFASHWSGTVSSRATLLVGSCCHMSTILCAANRLSILWPGWDKKHVMTTSTLHIDTQLLRLRMYSRLLNLRYAK